MLRLPYPTPICLRRWIAAPVLLLLVYACGPEADVRFVSLGADRTGIGFANTITVTDEFNPLTYEYIYNGAGVGIGDLNGDGLPDIYLAGNQVTSRLYLNRGNMSFADVTLQSEVATERWCTGVALADVDNDGRTDIYVSVAGFGVDAHHMGNLLFLNQGNDAAGVPTFREVAAERGLADTSYTSHTAFLDYDLDGDLDAYVLNNALEADNRNRLRPIVTDGSAASTDRLYRNDGRGYFTDVSAEAGVTQEGYGLGVTVSDLNADGWPDIYVANDFLSNDLVWINQQDGTFRNRAKAYFPHTSHNGMGVDVADINNDGFPDVMELDMLPADNYRRKMMLPYVNRDNFQRKRASGYHDQYMRNTLQLNRGSGPGGEPRFTDIGNLAGVAATDWSWAVLLADYDLDGRKDVFVTNGYRRDVTNLDFISYGPYNAMFGSESDKRQRQLRQLESIDEVPLTNYVYRNEGDLRFSDQRQRWMAGEKSYSTGAAYGDLDLDGDLDLVVSNLDGPAEVLENRSNQDGTRHSLTVNLVETERYLHAFHARVYVYTPAGVQLQELYPVRGYLSSVSPTLSFGLGAAGKVDSVVTVWNNGYRQLTPVDGSTATVEIAYQGPPVAGPVRRAVATSVYSIQDATTLDYVHPRVEFDDFRHTFTLVQGTSRRGPALAVGDVDGNGSEDIVVGGGAGGVLQWLSDSGMTYPIDSFAEQLVTDLALWDVDGDGDLDLYAAVGGNHLRGVNARYTDRLYRNDGRGGFTSVGDLPAIPDFPSNCVRPADFDGDGDVDLFIGGGGIPARYPNAAPSTLLENRGGRLIDVTPPALKEAGVVTDARWLYDRGTRLPRLVVAASWQPLVVHAFTETGWVAEQLPWRTPDGGPMVSPCGWWSHLNAVDVDGDGLTDLVAGNTGENGPLRTSPERPVTLYAKDFDDNGAVDPLLFHYADNELVAFPERDLLLKQIPSMKRRFPDYASYARASLSDVLTETDRDGSEKLRVTDFRSYFLRNRGDGSFVAIPLPTLAQTGPIRASVAHDFSGDGRTDLLVTGNTAQMEITQFGQFDGDYGTLLVQGADGSWSVDDTSPYAPQLSGEVTQLRMLRWGGSPQLLVGAYGDTLRLQPLVAPAQIVSR